MESYEKMRIPSEIFTFFTSPGGHSLIVRGVAGAGKTTFALQVIEELAHIEKGYYFSTRVSDSALMQHFPWLEDRLMGIAYPSVKDPSGKISQKSRNGLSKLKGLGSQQMGAPKKEMSISIGRDLGELESLYELVETMAPARTLIVIDSIDALAERYGMTFSSLISALQKDLVEGYGSNVLYVLENTEQSLDYLGDGVVIVSRSEFNRRRVREIEIVKLRGCEIQQPKYLFTLKGGKIQTFGYGSDRIPAHTGWMAIEDHNGHVSSGIIDLDRLTNGGLERGSMVLVELGPGVPSSVSGLIEQSLVANFVSMRRGVLWVPLRKVSADAVRTQMASLVSKEQFERCVRVPEVASQMEASAPYIMPVEGSNAATDLKWKTISYSLSGTESPMLSLLGFDTLESIYGEKVMDQMPEHLGIMKRNKGVCVCITSPSSRSKERLSDLANVHIKADRIGGTIVIYGEEPFTECNALAMEERAKGGKISLTPIV
ncbi:MAG: circadian clock protein KaiC [Methanomassiliicoccales archaeon PtaU1.Bin124]|nr:MAG: circadian clock protein KaiC [Methanomassiliicoccales archaeon PtaU1.Bin124]